MLVGSTPTAGSNFIMNLFEPDANVCFSELPFEFNGKRQVLLILWNKNKLIASSYDRVNWKFGWIPASPAFANEIKESKPTLSTKDRVALYLKKNENA